MMNWGAKIVLGMGSFMLFIIGMVIYMFHVHGRDALVEENYYEKGINYNETYDAEQQVWNDHAKPKISVTASQVIVELTTPATYELTLMRPSNKLDDVHLKGETSEPGHLILLDQKKLARGIWFLQLRWKANGKNYLFKNNLSL